MAKPGPKPPQMLPIDTTTHLPQQGVDVTPVPVQMPNGVRIQATSVIRSGPIPSPRELLEYNDLDPTLANRIVAMAEREQAFRHNQDDLATRADIKHRDDVVAAQREAAKGVFRADILGQILGWSVGVLCVCGAVYTAIHGVHPTVPIALVGLPVVSLIKAIRQPGNGNGSNSTTGKSDAQKPTGQSRTPAARKKANRSGGQGKLTEK